MDRSSRELRAGRGPSGARQAEAVASLLLALTSAAGRPVRPEARRPSYSDVILAQEYAFAATGALLAPLGPSLAGEPLRARFVVEAPQRLHEVASSSFRWSPTCFDVSRNCEEFCRVYRHSVL